MSEDSVSRSTFVTVIAWLSIVGSGFMCLVGSLQNVMIHTLMTDMPSPPHELEEQSSMAHFFMNNMEVFFALILIYSIMLLISSVGLLRRKEWARITFVALLLLSLLWIVGSFVALVASHDSFLGPDVPGDEEFTQIINLIMYLNIGLSLVIAGLTGWIILKLCREPIRQEFS